MAVELDSASLSYDQLVVEVLAPAETEREIDHASQGSAVTEGLGMTLFSPIGCVSAGMAYPLCVAASPIFPFWFAMRHQDAGISAAQLESVASAIESIGFVDRLRESVKWRATSEGLPVGDGSTAANRVARLVVQPGALHLVHDGYDDGWISITQPYVVTLYDPEGKVFRQLQSELSRRIQIESWDEQIAELPDTFSDWEERIGERAVMDTVLEWSPRIVLEPVHPMPVVKRSPVGIRQERWPDVESTRPRVAWQSLGDVLPPSILAEVTDTTYELEILPRGSDTELGRGADPAEFRYAVGGLAEPTHELAVDLEPCASHAWRPRARFRHRGVLHTTAWRVRPWGAMEYVPHSYVLRAAPLGCEGKGVNSAPFESAAGTAYSESVKSSP